MSSVKVIKHYPIQKFWTIDLSTKFRMLDPPCEDKIRYLNLCQRKIDEDILFLFQFLMQRQRKKLSEFKTFQDEIRDDIFLNIARSLR